MTLHPIPPNFLTYEENFVCNKKIRMPSKHKMYGEEWKQVGELAVIYADEGEGGDCVHCVPVGRSSYPTPQYINGLTALTTSLMYIDAYLHLLDALAVTKYRGNSSPRLPQILNSYRITNFKPVKELKTLNLNVGISVLQF
jgi:hypothetical protein